MTPAPAPARTLWDNIRDAMVLVTFAGMVWLVLHQPVPGPGPTPTVDTTTLGHSYGITLANTYADAWDVAANDIDAGKTIEAAQADLQSTWQASRTAAFAKDVAPTFASIVPEQTEPDATSRPRWSKAARDFAAGLRTVK